MMESRHVNARLSQSLRQVVRPWPVPAQPPPATSPRGVWRPQVLSVACETEGANALALSIAAGKQVRRRGGQRAIAHPATDRRPPAPTGLTWCAALRRAGCLAVAQVHLESITSLAKSLGSPYPIQQLLDHCLEHPSRVGTDPPSPPPNSTAHLSPVPINHQHSQPLGIGALPWGRRFDPQLDRLDVIPTAKV